MEGSGARREGALPGGRVAAQMREVAARAPCAGEVGSGGRGEEKGELDGMSAEGDAQERRSEGRKPPV